MANQFAVNEGIKGVKVGDTVTLFNLVDGKLYDKVKVTYVYGVTEFEISDAKGQLIYFGSSAIKNMVVITKAMPENWPPRQNDVWSIGGYVWHTLGSTSSPHFRRASAASTTVSVETVLRDYGNGQAKLLYRHA